MPDNLADPALTGGDKMLVAGHEIGGVRTYLRVPLRKDDALLGFLVALVVAALMTPLIARLARRIGQKKARAAVIVIGLFVTAVLFWQQLRG